MKILLLILGIVFCSFVIFKQGEQELTDMTSLIIGIASSLIATFIFILASEIIRKFIIPWYADKIYRGCRIDGKWQATLQDNSLHFHLDQKGDVVTGQYWHSYGDETDYYILKGHIRDSYFMLTAYPKSVRHVDAFAALFKIKTSDGHFVLSGDILCQGEAEISVQKDITFKWSNS